MNGKLMSCLGRTLAGSLRAYQLAGQLWAKMSTIWERPEQILPGPDAIAIRHGNIGGRSRIQRVR